MTIAEILRSHRYDYSSESILQAGIARVLTENGVEFKREHALDGKSRIDFLCKTIEDFDLGVEVKIKGSRNKVIAQLQRYAARPEISEMILVTTKNTLRGMPPFLASKPISIVYLGGW